MTTKQASKSAKKKVELRPTAIYFIMKVGCGPIFFEFGQPDFGQKIDVFSKWSTGQLWVLARVNDNTAKLVPVELATNSLTRDSEIMTTIKQSTLKKFGQKVPQGVDYITSAVFV